MKDRFDSSRIDFSCLGRMHSPDVAGSIHQVVVVVGAPEMGSASVHEIYRRRAVLAGTTNSHCVA